MTMSDHVVGAFGAGREMKKQEDDHEMGTASRSKETTTKKAKNRPPIIEDLEDDLQRQEVEKDCSSQVDVISCEPCAVVDGSNTTSTPNLSTSISHDAPSWTTSTTDSQHTKINLRRSFTKYTLSLRVRTAARSHAVAAARQ
ncbi:unnamed protein product [Amoebophrya sp. A120]|nr:unnamed protein product [Amoebophrya sp. A120]|eukprot:GSA120T00001551001.1